MRELLARLRKNNIHITLENENLKLKFDGDEISNTILEEIRNNKENLIVLLKSQITSNVIYEPIKQVKITESYLTTPAQNRFWILSYLDGGTSAYDIHNGIKIRGLLDQNKFLLSFQKLIERHESLRTYFKMDLNGVLRQFILPNNDFRNVIEVKDFCGENNKEEMVVNFLKKKNNIPFDLEQCPLIKASLIKMNDEEFIFFLSLHHIIGDGWSLKLIIDEIYQIYKALVDNRDVKLPELRIQYKDYSQWLIEGLEESKNKRSQQYWKNKFKGDLPVLNLPSFKTRPIIQTHKGNHISHHFSKEFLEKLKNFSKQQDITLFMTLMSGINALLYRYSGQDDIIIGTPIAGREHPDLEQQIGLYLNTLAIRTQLDKRNSLKDVAALLKKNLLDAYEHQGYPFDKLIEKLNLKRDSSRSALFDVMVILQNQGQLNTFDDGNKLQNILFEQYEFAGSSSQLDVSFVFTESEGLDLKIEYNTDIYDAELIERMFAHFENLLSKLIDEPQASITEVDYLSKSERHQLLIELNTSEVSFVKENSILDLFQEQVLKSPDSLALVFEDKEYSYQELNALSNQLGDYLRRNYNAGPNNLVGIQLERNDWMIITILGVLKSGSAYLPLDKDYPKERTDYMIEDSNCALIIDDQELLLFKSSKDLYAKENLDAGVSGSDLAYVIYTSGSTGRPKGVMIEHLALTNSIQAQQLVIEIEPLQKCLQFFSCSFDVSVFEIFISLTTGSTLYLIKDSDKKNPELLEDFVIKNKIDFITLPAAYLGQINIKRLPSIKKLVTGGEAVNFETVAEIAQYVDYFNAYGPTESCICTSIAKIAKGSQKVSNSISIGKPIGNTFVYILDEEKRLATKGIIGEIYIGGRGLARGYKNNDLLNSEKFVANPYRLGERMYRTGDLARWLPNGEIDFIGRIDDQVKIRGYRIELGEIERALCACTGVISAFVTTYLNPTGSQELVAYIISDKNAATVDLAAQLNKTLPVYMNPTYFIQLEKFPLTVNGKIDKKSLPLPEYNAIKSGKEYVLPKNEAESKLVQIWKNILVNDKISIKDDFFESGGHSLKVSQLLSQIYKEFEVNLGIKELFEVSILEDQAELISKSLKSKFVAIPKIAEQPDYAVSSAQQRLWLLSQFEESNAAYNIPGVYWFEGDLNYEILNSSFNKLVVRHEILRTVFKQTLEGEVRQHILASNEIGFEINNLDLRQNSNQDETIKNRLITDSLYSFDLAKGPLLRVVLYQLSDSRWVLSYVMHHVISDGWSMGILIKELFELYASGGEQRNLLPLRIQYKDYASWQLQQVTGDALQLHKNYWINKFSGELPVLELPIDKSRPQIKTFSGGTVTKKMKAENFIKLKEYSRARGGTLFMGLLGVVNVLLYRYSNQSDIILGTPTAGRDHIDLEKQVGLYLNTIALRTIFQGKESFNQLFDTIKVVALEAFEHQIYPFDQLVDSLNIQRDPGRSPLFDVMVTLQDPDFSEVNNNENNNLSVRSYEDLESFTSKFDLTFDFVQTSEDFITSIEYNSDIYQSETIAKMITHFESLVESVLGNPMLAVNELDYLSLIEKKEILTVFNSTKIDYPSDKTILDLFEYQVNINPDAIAVIFQETKLTYFELNEKSNQLAQYLGDKLQVKANNFIGIMLDRSEKMIIAILGVLKVGAAYVPIDPEIPQQRKEYILNDTQLKTLITQSDYIEELSYFNGTSLVLEDIEDYKISKVKNDVAIKQTDLAYVIYTSGSTGTIKGVLIEHSGLVNMAFDHIRKLELTPSDNVLQFMSISFDGSVLDIFMTLLSGGSLVLLSKNIIGDIDLFVEYITENDVTVMTVPPAYLRALDKNPLNTVKTIITAGEAAYVEDALYYADFKKFYNGYGPSECTVNSTLFRLDSKGNYPGVPIGYPADNKQIYILNEAMQLQGINCVGELCIAGTGLAVGYLNNEQLTKLSFVTNPFNKEGLIYKTGDLGRWSANGYIEFMGRKDDQVKIRGYRIELGEIESVLKSFPQINSAVVVARSNSPDEKELVAYIQSNDTALVLQNLKEQLNKILPVYMIPSHFVQLEEFPVTTNGKVDKKALPDPVDLGLSSGTVYVAPGNEIEEKLVLIWKEILGANKVGIKDNFFESGGHSLKATRLISQIHKEFDVKISLKVLFATPVLEDLGHLIRLEEKTDFHDILPVNNQTSYPLSAAQRRLWVLSQFSEGNRAYNMPGAYVLEGNLNFHAFEDSFKKLIERHESLRTTFRENENGEIHQYITPFNDVEFELPLIDITNEKDKEEQLRQIVQQEFNIAFDLSQGPLIRAVLVQMDEDKFLINCNMHHIISDGWSMSVLIRDLLQFYNNSIKESVFPMKPLLIQYKDYVIWQQKQLEGESLKKHQEYWLKQFEGDLPVLELSGDKTRPLVKTYNGANRSRIIVGELSKELKALNQEQGSTLFMSLLAIVNALFHRYTGQEDIIIGSPIAGREHIGLEQQIGFYLNTLALRTQFKGSDSYETLLSNIIENTLKAYEHQIYPFDALVDDLELHRDTSRSALFDVMIILQNAGISAETDSCGLKVSTYNDVQNHTSKFDLTLIFTEVEDKIELNIEYNTDIYLASTIERLLHHFEQLLAAALKNPQMPIENLDYLSTKEKDQLLNEFNGSKMAYPKDKTLIELFLNQVTQRPESIALVFEEKEFTFRELDEKSNRLAHYLMKHYDLKIEDLVGIKLERSELLIVAILGVLKTGAAYVPIDPENPQERIDYILEDSDCKVLIDEIQFRKFEEEQSFLPNDVIKTAGKSSDLAYVIYTSGSTGKPKGCMVQHQGVINRIEWMWNEFDYNAEDIILQKTTFTFDVSVWELFMPLCWGIKMVMCNKEDVSSPNRLLSLIENHKITCVHFVPSMLNAFISSPLFENDDLKSRLKYLKRVSASGEALSAETVKSWYNKLDTPIFNLYGPTEASIEVTCYETKKGDLKIPIGKPIWNTQIYITDSRNELVPMGVVGEINIAGDGLARGYLNQYDLTQTSFVPNPFEHGKKMYKTGDVGKWLPEGNIEYLGRKDTQIKIQGYRIELGEIESAICSYPDIDYAIAVVKSNPDESKELVAYIVSKKSLSSSEIRSWLSRTLPAYMLPSYFIQVEKLLLNASGKADRKKIMQMQGVALSSEAEYVEPRNETEEKLTVIWQELLGTELIGVKDNFFDLGGQSIKAIKLNIKIKNEFDIDLDLRTIFLEPTIEKLAEKIINDLWLLSGITENTDEFDEIKI
ncbi:non-ribosomal peptide synthetase [Flavobacterium algoritolerans]|uniref:Amino acid adenylation domain-containing protein n=1 Tax=Flavobacterium algoritolerans TaxID=3041254 RepID=A0ABT6VCN1_9FLAO|nr:non-ribosomal peptide synthetase [Flavobacterium algoritolerans]MDI5895996.1 amino acid adenylation domain-containing protein [Flavobacterium algoritolerans]